jgi:alpha-glucosidase
MPWTSEPGGGFTDAGVEPWLPFGDLAAANVVDQRADPGSVLHLVRDLIALRRATPDLVTGAYDDLGADDAAWSFRRGAGVQVVLNLGDEPVAVPVVIAGARLARATDRTREGDQVGDSVEVGGRHGVVLVAGGESAS